jgi:hypothetical protein
MQDVNQMKETLRKFWRVEHNRLHQAQRWPDSPYKDAVLAAVHSALERLEASALEPFERPACMTCSAGRTLAPVLMFPSRPKESPAGLRPAA